MFGDIGLSELLIIAVVIVFVTRPQDLPVLMRRFGIIYAHIQRFMQGLWGGWQEKLGLFSTQNQGVNDSGKPKGGKGGGD